MTALAPARPGPVSGVLAAFEGGATSFRDVAARTGLPVDVVRAAVDQLVRLGRLEARELAVGCPPSGCRSCASGASDGTAGCGSGEPRPARRGPVLISISVRRTDPQP